MPRMRTALPLAAALLALTLAACAGGGVNVRRTGVPASPRPAGCRVEIHYYRAPDRPHEVLAEMETHLTRPPADPPQALVPMACELGADALVVEKSMVLNEMGHVLLVGAAIRFKPEGAKPVAPAAPAAAPVPAAPPQVPQPAPKADEMPH